ncbi:MAG TPA: TonB-dependent receptor [Terriglobales bacterium]|nr:TonB-dependent receptor [Terriglobales bacterium]
MLLLLSPNRTAAQAVFGQIYGVATDPAGAAVPSVKVTVTSVSKGTSREVTTNETGNYTVTHLIPDTYDIRAEIQGFKVFEAKGIKVFADQGAQVNIKLEIGAAVETVTVTAEDVPLLKTDRADVATTFSEKTVTELPVSLGRNFTDLQLLTPGTQLFTWQHASSENPQSSKQINVNGQHFAGTSFQLDGTENRDPILGIIVVNPPLESVTETKVATQNYDAEFGQALAAVITAQTKSGSNDVHGSAYWFRHSDEQQAVDATIGVDPVTGRQIADALHNQFGGTLGGPILKNKLFVFGAYEGTRDKVGRAAQLTVPTALVRSTCLNPASLICDLSEYTAPIFNPFTGDPGPDSVIGTPDDPGTGRTQFAGNIIPSNLLSPQAVALLSLLPPPSAPGTLGNFTATGTGGFDANLFSIRTDYAATDRLHIYGRYSFAQYSLTGRGAFDTDSVAVGGRGLGLNGFAGQSASRDQSIAAGFDYSFSPSLLMDFRFGWFKYRVNVNPNGLGTTPATDAGLVGLNFGNDFTSGMPAFFIGDQGQLGGDIEFGYALSDRLTRCNCPLIQNEDQFQFVNNWTKIHGNHAIKWGADIRYARNLRVPSDRHRAGELSFDRRFTSDNGTDGLGIATFLLGGVTRFTRYPPDSPTDAGERQKRWFFYGQDTWRATPKLTVNVGLRWEIYFPESVTGPEKGGFLDLETGQIRVAGVGGIQSNMNVQNSLSNFAPRLGLAYQITPKTILRMGYGRSFDIGVFGSIFGHAVTQNLPVLPIQENDAGTANAQEFNLSAPGGVPGVAPPVIPSDGLITLSDRIFQRARPNQMRLPTVDAWNITIQREITPTLTVELAYVGNKGTHVFAGDGPAFNVNQATVEGFAAGVPRSLRLLFFNRYPFQSVNPATGACTAVADPGPNGVIDTPPGGDLAGDDVGFCWGQSIDFFGNLADNNYNALQMRVEKRFSKGYQFLAHYTWAQAFNEDGDYFPIDPRVNYGPNNFNRRHVFVFTNLVELPFGRGKKFGNDVSRGLDYLIGGWQISTVTNWSSGLPFSVRYDECGSDRDTGPCRPDLIGDVDTGDENGWLPTVGNLTTNGASIGPWQRPQVGEFGTSGRNSFRGPQFFNTDLSIFKNFTITERVRAQFRFNAFNVFNRVNWGTPGVFWSEFGFGGDTCIDCGGRAMTIDHHGGPMRQLQFGAKVSF